MSIIPTHEIGIKRQPTLALSLSMLSTHMHPGGVILSPRARSTLGQAWGKKETLDSLLLWEEKPCGVEGRGRESQTISALIRALSASVSPAVCSLVCVREFGTDPKLVK